ncbi:putative F-box domain-containing protein [Tanacetum coccineum]|uniref:F-box domain-containing protein n=1 Tax=Tanacetum coccineum TaxID=301880 RepID=A0ABQ4WKZ1_9ASTR
MSDHIPFEIQSEIMKRLPVKSLIQFRSVSKPWKSFIDSSKFIANYHRTQQHHHILFSLPVPVSVNQLNEPTIVGSSQGLLCFYDIFDDSKTKTTAVIWNPIIRKSVTISVPNDIGFQYSTAVGFGVTPDTSDPKLVKVSFDRSLGYWGDCDTVVEVFTLSTKAWKRLTTNLPLNSTAFGVNQVVLDRFIYWRAYDLRFEDPHYHGLEQIMSFDMITEEFNELDLPDSLARNHRLFMSKARESLVVAQMKWVINNQVVSVWMMEHGDPKSLTNFFTINSTNELYEVRGFRKSGEPLIEMIEDDAEPEHVGLLSVYEPCSGHINSIGITTIEDSCNDYDNGDIANVDDNRLLLEQARLKCSYSAN